MQGHFVDQAQGEVADFSMDTFEKRHHFDPPHRAEPERYAQHCCVGRSLGKVDRSAWVGVR